MELIDDHPVVSYRGRFEGRFETDVDSADAVRDGNVVVWLVRALCQPPSYHPVAKDADERYRFSVQKVEAALPLVGSLRDQAIAYMDHGFEQTFLSPEDEFKPRLPFDHGFGIAYSASSESQIDELVEWLDDIGELHEDETLVETFRRLCRRPDPAMVQA